MSCEDDFDTYLKSLQTSRGNREKDEGVPNFEDDFLDLLEASKRELEQASEHNEPDSSQELDELISDEKSTNTVKKTNNEWKKCRADQWNI